MKSYAQRMRKPQIANLQQSPAVGASIGNQAMGALMGYDASKSKSDPALEDKMRAKLQKQFEFPNQEALRESGGVPLPPAIQKEYEEKSGVPLDDVRVHYDSEKPNEFDAAAYAYGSNIYVAPKQEHLLQHEIGHVIQQKVGMVKKVGSIGSYPVNDSVDLEREADTINNLRINSTPNAIIQRAPLQVNERLSQIDKEIERLQGGIQNERTLARIENLNKERAFYEKRGESEQSCTYEKDLEAFKIFSPKEFDRDKYGIPTGVSKNENGEIGSIYFGGQYFNFNETMPVEQREGGRFRLIHFNGPKISWHKDVLRTNVASPKKGKLQIQLYEYFLKKDENKGSKLVRNTPKKEEISKAEDGQFFNAMPVTIAEDFDAFPEPSHPSRGAFCKSNLSIAAGDIERLYKMVAFAQSIAESDSAAHANHFLYCALKKDEKFKDINLNCDKFAFDERYGDQSEITKKQMKDQKKKDKKKTGCVIC